MTEHDEQDTETAIHRQSVVAKLVMTRSAWGAAAAAIVVWLVLRGLRRA